MSAPKKSWDEEETSENLPELVGPFDLPQLTPEQLKEREKLQKARARIDHHLAIRDGLKPPNIKTSNPKNGSAAAWIDTLCPNGEWRLKSAKAIWRDIKARDYEGPSYTAIARELRNRR